MLLQEVMAGKQPDSLAGLLVVSCSLPNLEFSYVTLYFLS